MTAWQAAVIAAGVLLTAAVAVVFLALPHAMAPGP